MQTGPLRAFLFVALVLPLLAFPQRTNSQSTLQNGGDFSTNPEAKKLPTDVILVKGAWASASDSSTPVPEAGSVTNSLYSNRYFGSPILCLQAGPRNIPGPLLATPAITFSRKSNLRTLVRHRVQETC